MKKMTIFEPAMCCSTGVCGPSVDKELLRVSALISNLKNKGVTVERYNLSSNPQAFIDNKEINDILNSQGVEILPVTMVDGAVVKTKAYPTDEEFQSLLGLSDESLKTPINIKAKGCGCKSGCCD